MPISKEVIALANTDGGTIYVGIDNNGDVVGVSNPDEAMAQIGNMIRDGIKPDLTAYSSIETVNENGVKMIRVTVLRGVKRPYHLTDKGLKPGGVLLDMGYPLSPRRTRRFVRCCVKATVQLLTNPAA